MHRRRQRRGVVRLCESVCVLLSPTRTPHFFAPLAFCLAGFHHPAPFRLPACISWLLNIKLPYQDEALPLAPHAALLRRPNDFFVAVCPVL
jgi:hypothetical protein